jgi:hypothetical protein
MSGGWLAGVFYPALVALTLVFGFRMVFVRTPWQRTAIAVFAGYFGVATEASSSTATTGGTPSC